MITFSNVMLHERSAHTWSVRKQADDRVCKRAARPAVIPTGNDGNLA
jgi:hypothetical protein